MSTIEAKAVFLKAAIAEGEPREDHFEVRTVAVDLSTFHDGILFRPLVLSADPYLRWRFKTMDGGVVDGFVAGRVEESKHPRFAKGSLWGASLPFQTLLLVPAAVLDNPKVVLFELTKYVSEEQISLGVGALGMPGATAWGGFFDVLKPQKGETILVSAVTGAVGSLVAQLASKVTGCTVVGTCGGPEKARLARELGCHHVIDYRQAPDTAQFAAAIRAVAPEGIDLNFENVGGHIFDAAFQCLRPGGRLAVCGSISQYNKAQGDAPNHINVAAMIYSASACRDSSRGRIFAIRAFWRR
jgi:NADPH-dependent curcumin reductase CurA